MLRTIYLLFFSVILLEGTGQYNWKQEKDEKGIKVFSSDIANADYKAIKVECTLNGSYSKLISILCNVSHNNEWVYNSKYNVILKKNSWQDFIYYTETRFPWPMSNRDVVIHLRVQTDSLPKFLIVTGTGEPAYVPEMSDKVRVPHYLANWKVSMPTPQTLKINYIIEADPGGSIPSWLANIFIDKGPYETFKKLSEMLVK